MPLCSISYGFDLSHCTDICNSTPPQTNHSQTTTTTSGSCSSTPQVRINTQTQEERRDQCANERGKWRGPESGTREFKLLRRVMSETNINWRSLRVSSPTFACVVTITALKHVHPTNNLVCLDLERKINNDSTLDWGKHCIQLSVTRWASFFLKRPSCLSASFGNSIICQESGFALIIHSQWLRRKATFPHYANKTFSTSGGFMKKIQVATFSKLTLPIEGWWQIKSALSQPPVGGWNMGGRSTAQEKKTVFQIRNAVPCFPDFLLCTCY